MKHDNDCILKLTGQEVCECASVQSMFWTKTRKPRSEDIFVSHQFAWQLWKVKIASTSTQMCKECVWSDQKKKTTSLCWLYLKSGNTVFCFLFKGRTVYRTESKCMSSACNNQSVIRLLRHVAHPAPSGIAVCTACVCNNLPFSRQVRTQPAKMVVLSLKICVRQCNVVKTMQFEPSTAVYDACRIIRERVPEAQTGQGENCGVNKLSEMQGWKEIMVRSLKITWSL